MPEKVARSVRLSVDLNTHPNKQFSGHVVDHMPSTCACFALCHRSFGFPPRGWGNRHAQPGTAQGGAGGKCPPPLPTPCPPPSGPWDSPPPSIETWDVPGLVLGGSCQLSPFWGKGGSSQGALLIPTPPSENPFHPRGPQIPTFNFVLRFCTHPGCRFISAFRMHPNTSPQLAHKSASQVTRSPGPGLW